MKQLVQNLRSGEFRLLDSPSPERPSGFVRVANRVSVISAGTERSTVRAAQASLLGKARQRPEQVRAVFDSIKKEGLLPTIEKVRERLDQPVTLGYSCAGVVLETDPNESRFQAGDRVACGGAGYAVHAQEIVVPRNLVTLIPENIPFENAAFTTLGAIALQGVRRAETSFGDVVLVIGLGLLGQITWQLLAASGCIPIGVDISAEPVERAKKLGLQNAFCVGKNDIVQACDLLTHGNGTDSVIITAAGSSREPILLAGNAVRERGRIVVVGMVPMDIPREPFYRKELDIIVSRSYGPGRYDSSYEEHGTDYPYSFVRWTEGRNMGAFLDSVANARIDVSSLVTHTFPFEHAINAYDIVSGKVKEPHLAILLEYDHSDAHREYTAVPQHFEAIADSMIGVSFIGAGNYARSYLLPHLEKHPKVELRFLSTARGYTAVTTGEKFSFRASAQAPESCFADDSTHIVFVATRHDSHAEYAIKALKSGKHVFLEKPLALNFDQLREITTVAENSNRILQVGYNRRFSAFSTQLKEHLSRSPMPTYVSYRINAGPLPSDHWLLDQHQGGGRIIGECCHFVDLVQYLVGSYPTRVRALQFGNEASGATAIQLEFADHSIASIAYQANASSLLPKERIEAYSGGYGGVIDNWNCGELHSGRKRTKLKSRRPAKGYKEQILCFLDSVQRGSPNISLASLTKTSKVTFAILESIACNQPVSIH